MKKNQQRDLLVMLNDEFRSQHAIDYEVEWLHDVLYHVEAIDNFCIAHEILNINSHKIITRPDRVKRTVLRKTEKAFEFISNKN